MKDSEENLDNINDIDWTFHIRYPCRGNFFDGMILQVMKGNGKFTFPPRGVTWLTGIIWIDFYTTKEVCWDLSGNYIIVDCDAKAYSIKDHPFSLTKESSNIKAE